jgi:hypothetical protein
MGEVRTCGICGSSALVLILDMGMQPLAERYGSHTRYPLALLECQECTLVQLSHIVDQGELFPPDHPYTSGTTAALRDHFAALASRLAPLAPPPGMVVDIGANDGTLLAAYPDGTRRVAVEPTGQAGKCRERGFATYQEWFTAGLALEIVRRHGKAQVVTATNVLAHVPDPHDFMAGVAVLLAADGVFVTENHDAAQITGGLQTDAVYHEHLRYYSVASLSRLLAMFGLQADDTERIPTHGGSLRVWASKRQGGLQRRADAAALGLRQALGGITDSGHKIYGVGATTRATPLIHYAGIGGFITCVCEVAGSEKIGLVMPGTGIPVVDEKRLIEDQPAYALLFAHHIADSLMPKLRAAGYRGKFILPVPGFRIADA